MSARSGLASLLLPDETSRRALEETLADWREERRRATSIHARARSDAHGCLSVLRVILGEVGRELVASDVWRLFGWTVLFAIAAAVLNPFAWAFASTLTSGFADTLAVGLLLVPGALVPAFLLVSALGPGQKRNQPVPALACVLVSFVFMIVVLEWVMPAANQHLRTAVSAHADAATPPHPQVVAPAAGSNELALQELIRKANAEQSNDQQARRVISVRLALLLAAPTGFLLGVAMRKRLAGRTPWRVAQGAGAAATVAAAIAANYLWPVIGRLLPWPTAVRLGRLNAELWLALAVSWMAILALAYVRERGTGEQNPSPEPASLVRP